MIQFLLNQTVKTLDDVDPNTTVLNWLRGSERRCGTKEGCASGDCGACTVVLGSSHGGKMRYDTANSCITLIGQLDGKQLLTVEDLADNGALHPVQQAMADCHASQCGFCTPGFVMSMFALQKTQVEATRHDIEQHLGGNLCRCTGYRPIIEAAERACNMSADRFTLQEEQTARRLEAMSSSDTAVLMKSNRCLLPKNLDQLAEIYEQNPEARLLAGGTDLALSITQQYKTMPLIIGISQIKELQEITVTADEIRIGSAATLQACQQALAGHIPAFSQLLERFASRQIRNHGTLGGNLANASPIGDCAPVLLALDAVLELRSGAETRRLPLDRFFLGYRQTALAAGEFISRIVIPRVTLSPKFSVWKVSKRMDDDISAVLGAFNLHLNEGVVMSARVAFGGMAAVPARAKCCEQTLIGQPLNEETLARASRALSEDFQPLSDFRGSGRYRLAVAQNLLRRLMLQSGDVQMPLEVHNYVS
jgi:xanthine dehydrogenase small subunit